LQRRDFALDWFAPGLNATARTLAPEVVLCMGRMANCYAGSLQRALPSTAVVATMRTGKSLPWLFRRSLKIARHVVANSSDARDTLVQRYTVAAEKISVIHNSLVFPAESSLQRNETLRATHGASPSTLVLLCVAMFRPEKNQRELIEIAATFPRERDWQLWLAGEGPARAGCEQLVAAKNLGERVKFLGFAGNPTALYMAADVAVHASWSESLSNFLIEAQAHGLPVVAYAAQGIGECFVPQETGWIIPRDDRVGFSRVIENLVAESSETRAKRSAAARAFARSTFDPERQVESYLNLFHRLMTHTPLHPH
jgi:glycosyltransferase involved in cell wall biosynthesis